MKYKAKLEHNKEEFLQFRRFHKWLHYRAFYTCLKFLFLLCALCLGVLSVILIYTTHTITKYVICGFLLELYLFWYFYRERFVAKQAVKSERENVGDGADVTFEENEIRISSTNIQEQYKYSAFTEIYHRRGIYYMYVGKKRCFFLPERCITEGDPNSFGVFIAEKTGHEVKEVK